MTVLLMGHIPSWRFKSCSFKILEILPNWEDFNFYLVKTYFISNLIAQLFLNLFYFGYQSLARILFLGEKMYFKGFFYLSLLCLIDPALLIGWKNPFQIKGVSREQLHKTNVSFIYINIGKKILSEFVWLL